MWEENRCRRGGFDGSCIVLPLLQSAMRSHGPANQRDSASMSATKTHGVHYGWTAAVVMGAVAVVAWLVKDQWLVFSAAIVGLYVLHMVSVRYVVRAHADQLAALTGGDLTFVGSETDSHAGGMPAAELSAEAGKRNGKTAEEPSESDDALREALDSEGPVAEGADQPAPGFATTPLLKEVAIPRHFMLGTVAIVRNVMEPESVARVLMEQRQQPGKRFGELAVAMGVITEEQLDMLLEAQQHGLFTDDEIREARQRLESFRRAQAEPAASA